MSDGPQGDVGFPIWSNGSRQSIRRANGRKTELESLTNADAPCEIVLAPCEICSQIDVILFAQHIANACPSCRKQMVSSEKLT
jgi:hypothetical protein